MSTDERRARALLKATCDHYGDPYPENPDLQLTIILARAIRTSDEAAGMVLVPREATEEMLTEGVWDICPWHPASTQRKGGALRCVMHGMECSQQPRRATMDDVQKALEMAAEAVCEERNHPDYPCGRGDIDANMARAAVLSCAKALPPTMTVAELAAAQLAEMDV